MADNTVTVKKEPKYKVGYVVSVDADGELAFNTFGEEQGLIELLGLHRFAEMKMSQLLDMNQRTGEFTLRTILNKVNGLGGATSVDGK